MSDYSISFCAGCLRAVWQSIARRAFPYSFPLRGILTTPNARECRGELGGMIYTMDDQARRSPKKTDHVMVEAFQKRWGCPAYPVACQIIDAVTIALGSDTYELSSLVLNQAIKCIQLDIRPERVDVPGFIKQFRPQLSSYHRASKLASINKRSQLVQKDTPAMSKLGGNHLVLK